MTDLVLFLSAEEYLTPEYENVSCDKYFMLSYHMSIGLDYRNDQFYRGPDVPAVDIVNPNLKDLRKTLKYFYNSVASGEHIRFKPYLSDSFSFDMCLRGKRYLNSVGVLDRLNFFLSPNFLKEGSLTLRWWNGLKGVKMMFKYIPRPILLAVFSGGYYITLYYEDFQDIFGDMKYNEIVQHLREEVIDLDKGAAWISKDKINKFFSKVYLPYFWNNIYIPEKVKKAPVSLETPYHFLPPPVRVCIKWDPKEKRWLLNSFTYGWPEIDW